MTQALNLSAHFAEREAQYAEGRPVLSAPLPVEVDMVVQRPEERKHHAAVLKYLLTVEDDVAVPTWFLRNELKIHEKLVEQVAVNTGLALIYVDARKFGAKRKGLRRSVVVDHQKLLKYGKALVKAKREKETNGAR